MFALVKTYKSAEISQMANYLVKPWIILWSLHEIFLLISPNFDLHSNLHEDSLHTDIA